MVKLTMIARVTDGLPLAEGLDDGREQRDLEFYKQQAKALFKKLSHGQHEPSRMSIETGPYIFHYIIEARVCYLTMCDRSYPKKLAFQYLEELKNEFEKLYQSQVETVARPYAFIKFDTFIQKTRKLYLDTRTQRNLAKLNDDLYEVQQIMTRNVQGQNATFQVLFTHHPLEKYSIEVCKVLFVSFLSSISTSILCFPSATCWLDFIRICEILLFSLPKELLRLLSEPLFVDRKQRPPFIN